MRIANPTMRAPGFWSQNGSISVKLMAAIAAVALLHNTEPVRAFESQVRGVVVKAQHVATDVRYKAHAIGRDLRPTARFMGAQVGDEISISLKSRAAAFGKVKVIAATPDSLTFLGSEGKPVTVHEADVLELSQYTPMPEYHPPADPPPPEPPMTGMGPKQTALRAAFGLKPDNGPDIEAYMRGEKPIAPSFEL